jgi:hypothetical protein
MKKFTCLLITLLAISSVYTQNCAAVADHSLYQILNLAAYGNTGTAFVGTGTAVATTGSDTTCGNTGTQLCCDVTKLKTAASNEVTKVKNALTEFGSNVARIGGMWAKIATLVNASTANSTIDSATSAERSTASADQLKGWLYYTPTQFSADFDAFKTQVPTCFSAYWSAIQRIACDGCASQAGVAGGAAWTDVPRWSTDTTITISATGCSSLVDSCGKVWYFMHRFGWFAQGVALLNKKKETSGSTVTYSAPADLSGIYAAGYAAQTNPTVAILTLAEIDAAIGKCGPSVSTNCDTAAKNQVCRAFFSVWGNTINFGRQQTTFIKDYNPVSTVARRQLAVSQNTGAIKIVDTTNAYVDLASSTATITLATPVTLVTADLSAWSSGYGSATGGSSSGSSSKSAKVFIGTILSALFAVAFLN